jgi:hypothetical protein
MLEPFHIPVVVCHGIRVRPISLNYKTHFLFHQSSVSCVMVRIHASTHAQRGWILCSKLLSPVVRITGADSSVAKFLLEDSNIFWDIYIRDVCTNPIPDRSIFATDYYY